MINRHVRAAPVDETEAAMIYLETGASSRAPWVLSGLLILSRKSDLGRVKLHSLLMALI